MQLAHRNRRLPAPRPSLRRNSRPPDHRTQTRQQFTRRKSLRQIIVRANLQPHDPVGLSPSPVSISTGTFDFCASASALQTHPVPASSRPESPRQTARQCRLQPIRTRLRERHPITHRLQILAHQTAQLLIVVHQQQIHFVRTTNTPFPTVPGALLPQLYNSNHRAAHQLYAQGFY